MTCQVTTAGSPAVRTQDVTGLYTPKHITACNGRGSIKLRTIFTYCNEITLYSSLFTRFVSYFGGFLLVLSNRTIKLRLNVKMAGLRNNVRPSRPTSLSALRSGEIFEQWIQFKYIRRYRKHFILYCEQVLLIPK